MSKIVKYKGIHIIYQKQHRNNSSDVTFGIMTGSHAELKNGLAHLLEHCLAGHRTKTRSREECESFRIKHVPSLNAATSDNYMYIKFYESTRALDKILEFTSDKFFNGTSSKEEFENEKKIILNEIKRHEQNNNAILAHVSKNQVYENKSGFYDKLGTEKSLKAITQKDFEKFKSKHFCRQNFLFSITTNKPLFYVKKLINKYFIPNLKDNPNFEQDHFVITGLNKKDSVKTIKKQDTKLCTIKIVKEGFPYKKELSPKKDMVFNCIERPHGRVYEIYRLKNGITYETPYFQYPSNEDCGTITFTIKVLPKDIKKSIDLAAELFQSIYQNGITKEEYDTLEVLRKRKKDVAVKPPLKNTSTDRFSYFALRGHLYPIREFEKYRKKENYNSINDFSKMLFKPNRLFVTILGNFDKKDIYPLSKLKKLFNIDSETK